MSIINEPHEGHIEYYGANGIHCPGAVRYFPIQIPIANANGQLVLTEYHVANAITFYSASNNYTTYAEFDLFPDGTINIYGTNATLNGVTTWSDNSILTQGRADGRYATPACLTYANISGTPTLANVATSGNYTDLANTPNLSVYLTTASAASTYQTISGMSFYLTSATAASTYYPASNPNGYITSSALSPYQLSATNTWANLTGAPSLATVATSGNYNDLSNMPAAYSLPTASSTVLGGVKIGGNISIANGAISVNLPASYTLPAATNTTLGGVIVGANLSVSNGTISVNLPAAYTLPAATNSTLGGIIVGSNLTIANGVLSATSSGGVSVAKSAAISLILGR